MTALLSTKLKNSLPADCETFLKNIVVNGDKRGCSGFVKRGGFVVYVNTEVGGRGYLVRTAADIKDFRGGQNCYAANHERLLVVIDELLTRVHYPV